jgi:tellurite resistance protein TerC
MAAARDLLKRARKALRWDDTPPLVRRVIVGLIGTTVLLIGIALLVLPGPAFVVIPLGLAILATEFVWARRWLQRARDLMHRVKNRKNSGQKK